MSELPPTFVPGFHDEAAVRKMKYNTLGKTGLQVSRIGLGGTCFSSLFGKYDEEEAIATVRHAIKQGINYIDTAPYYGQGSSEKLLGKALKGIPRQAYYIATKVGRYGTTPETGFDYSAEKTLWSVDNSLKILGLDYVDIIQVHDIEFVPTLDTVLNECLPTLQNKVVKSGKARFIGVTGYPVSVLQEAIEKTDVNVSTIISYARLSLIDDTLSEYLPFFQSKGVTVINAASHQMGLLSNDGPQPWHPAHQETKDVCKQASEYCKQQGVELGRLALNHALTKPGLVLHLIGMNTRKMVDMNLDVVYNGLTEKEKDVLKYINEKFFSTLKQRHWEGVEISAYRKALGL